MPRLEARSVLAHTPEQLFDLAADVERYPEFLPWWLAARVQDADGNVYFTDQVVGIGPFRERFRSKTVLERPRRIDVTSSTGLFRTFHLTWRFDPLPDDTCEVALLVDLELRSLVLQRLFGRTIRGLVEPIMSAFAARARRLYGAG